uniref:Carnosine N-methyltransferase n=1 Tax=Panagrolaimus sp. JU765 TaxID=591449 RepID=A0AC34RGD4_9BILA
MNGDSKNHIKGSGEDEELDVPTARAESECAARMISDFRFYLPHIHAMNLREKNAVLSFTPEDQKLINLDQMLERHKEIIVAAQSNQAAVEERFPDHEKRHDVHILVPGVGLARLAWEYMNRGYSVVANEHDLSMIAVANFMLNSKLK